MCGPKYNTKVWRPEPRPIDDATPSSTHQATKTTKSVITCLYGEWGPSAIMNTRTTPTRVNIGAEYLTHVAARLVNDETKISSKVLM